MKLTENLKNDIKRFCSNAKVEPCGLIVEKNDYLSAHPCRNSANKTNFFSVNSYDYLKVSFHGKIIGCYHGHLSDNISFSFWDYVNCKKLELDWVLYNIKYDYFNLLTHQNCPQFLFKQFDIENANCYHLVRDYYYHVLNVVLPNLNIKEGWFENWNLSKMIDLCDSNSLKIKTINEVKEHDIIGLRIDKSYPTHFGIYIGNNYVLHHPRGGYSKIEFLEKDIQEKIGIVCRYEPS